MHYTYKNRSPTDSLADRRPNEREDSCVRRGTLTEFFDIDREHGRSVIQRAGVDADAPKKMIGTLTKYDASVIVMPNSST